MLSEKLRNRLSRYLKWRFLILYFFGTWAVLVSHSTDVSIRQSAGFILAGLFIRGWANCYAIKNDKLTTSGPYAYVRNPLYLGTFLVIVGFLVMLNVPLFIVVFFSCALALIYRQTITSEQSMLNDKFGQDYLDYTKAVPALFPTMNRYKDGEKWAASFSRYFRSQEYKFFLWIIILVIAFHLKDEFFIEGEGLDVKTVLLMLLVLVMATADILGEFLRKRNKAS